VDIMKRIYLFMLMLLMVGTVSFGFDVSIGAQAVGGYAGFLGKDYKDNYLDPWNSKRALFLGYGAGIFATLGLMDLIAIQPEVMVLGIGGADKDEFDDKYWYRSHHISPAVLIKARFGRINLLAGPMVMFKIGSGKYGAKYSDGTEDEFEFADDDLTNMLFAATVGVGIQYPLSLGSFIAQLRGIYSFTNWYNEDTFPGTDVWNPFAAMVIIGYSISLIPEASRQTRLK